ncbi:hypothetical protein FCV71_13135 [Vibrio lentus]|nr:hypothetical protein FCV71_13135 [Vibrio lentus]
MFEKYNHLTCGAFRLFDPLYKKTTLNILNMAHLKFETLPLRRAPHEANINFWEMLTFCKD